MTSDLLPLGAIVLEAPGVEAVDVMRVPLMVLGQINNVTRSTVIGADFIHSPWPVEVEAYAQIPSHLTLRGFGT